MTPIAEGIAGADAASGKEISTPERIQRGASGTAAYAGTAAGAAGLVKAVAPTTSVVVTTRGIQVVQTPVPTFSALPGSGAVAKITGGTTPGKCASAEPPQPGSGPRIVNQEPVPAQPVSGPVINNGSGVPAPAGGNRLVVGGGRANGFPQLAEGDVSLNISQNANAHVLADIRTVSPSTLGRFNEVVFERVPFDAITPQAIRNSAAVLQPGGRISITTGRLVDRAALQASLEQAGFRNVQVLEVGTGDTHMSQRQALLEVVNYATPLFSLSTRTSISRWMLSN